jgi:FkbM family methyltransferase
MLIPYSKCVQLLKEYNIIVKGILHIGAHECEEYSDYISNGVKSNEIDWIEANPKLVEMMKILGFKIHCLAVDNEEGIANFNITNNGQSSSLLDFGSHKNSYPNIDFIETITVEKKKLSTFFREHPEIDPAKRNFWNLDIQGVELSALKSAEEYLEYVDAIYSEVNIGEVYKGCGLLPEMDNFLCSKGFKRITIELTQANWGDALWVKDKYFSQFGQDKFLETEIFKGFKNGFFVDVGAHDGISLNNTLYFEKSNNWNGINIEPIKEVYDKLKIKRSNCINLNVAVSDYEGENDFICNSGYTEMLSGLKENFDSRHLERLNYENIYYGGNTKIIKVPVKKLENIFETYNVSHINYLSIDTEGAEFSVIKSINFDKVFIDIIGFENNYEDVSVEIIKFLEEKGFKVLKKYTDIFMIHKDSKFI